MRSVCFPCDGSEFATNKSHLRFFRETGFNSGIFRLFLAGFVLFFGFMGGASAATSDVPDTYPTIQAPVDELPSLVEMLRRESTGEVRIKYHRFTGTVRFMGTEPEKAVKTPANLSFGVSPEVAARSFLDVYGHAFGIKDQSEELSVMRSRHIAGQARSFVRFQQRYNGVPVMGGELIVQVKDNNNVVSINGEIVPDIYLETEPRIGADEAREIALGAVSKWYNEGNGAGLRATDPELWIYNPVLLGMEMNRDFLVWRMDVVSTDLEPINELVLVDAHLGGIVLHFNQFALAKNRIVYDNNNDYTAGIPGTGPVRTEGDGATGISDVDDAYDYAGDTYDYYNTTHGRDGINGSGMDMISTVRYCPSSLSCPYANAGWSGTDQQMVYGEGFASADDVVGHELTHGVTDYESNLFYYMQSGAINEHFSDMWGEFVDLTNGAGNDTAGVRWLMGENLSIGAIRDMSDPPAYSHPDKMTHSNYYCGSGDNGGVHYNSGVGNKLAYLLVDGDSFNGQTVTAIGMNKTAKIYYEAQTNMLISSSDYADLSDGLYQSCLNLIGTAGINSSDCQQVKNATLAVEMGQQPTSCPAPVAPVCDTGSPVDMFFDDLEDTGSGNWTHGAVNGSVDEWYYPANNHSYDFDATYSTSGTNNFWGYYYVVGDYAIAMTSNVTLPVDTGYMHFNHSYDFDYYSSNYYDGGVIEYSTNGGTTWNDAEPLFSDNGYTGTISSNYSNPLGGREAFTDISNGYISTRLNLSTLAGQNVRFRFRIGTDTSVSGLGWFIDDIRIYTCIDTTPPNITITSPQNISYESGTPITITYDSNEAIVEPDNYSLDGGVNTTFDNGTTTITPGLGCHNITVWAKDASGNRGSDTEYFTVQDTTSPAITFVDPTPEDNANLSVTSVTINVSHIELYSDTLVLNWNGTNESQSYPGPYTQINKNVSDGQYAYYVWANDTSGNTNQTETRTITIDTIPPAINMTSPQNNTTYTSSNVPLDVYANDPIDTWRYSLDGEANVTFVPNTTLTGLASGPHNVIVYADDMAGNMGDSNTVYFMVNDTTPPNITITSPQNISYESGTPITIAYDSDEAIIELDNYSLDGGANMTFNNGTTTITPGLGSHNITVWAKDASGNRGSDTEYFTVQDTTSPAITFVDSTPEDNANLSVTSVTINVSHIELYSDTLVLNWNGTNENQSYPGPYTQINKNVSDGQYAYYVWANDTSGNSNQTETRTITIDTIPPAIAITSPQNISYESGTPITIAYDSNETIIEPDNYSLDGGVNTTFDNGTTTITPGLGSHNITVWAKDASGNRGSDTEYFTVQDTTPPNITYTTLTPSNGASLASSTTSVTINVTLSETPDECTLTWKNVNESMDKYGSGSNSYCKKTKTVSAGNGYTFKVWANDSSGNLGNETKRTFSVKSASAPPSSSSGGGGGGGGGQACIEEGFQEMSVDMMNCIIKKLNLRYKKFYDVPVTTAATYIQNSDKTFDYPAPTYTSVRETLSKGVTTIGGDNIDIYSLTAENTLNKLSYTDSILVARGDLEADSIAAVAYAKASNMPILLTKPDELPEITRDIIEKLGPKRVTIVGGPVAVSKDVEAELKGISTVKTVNRIAGADRSETAAEIAKSIKAPDTIVIADGYGKKLEAVFIANAYKAPIVYVTGDEVPEVTKDYLKANRFNTNYRPMKVVFVKISDKAKDEIENIMYPTTTNT